MKTRYAILREYRAIHGASTSILEKIYDKSEFLPILVSKLLKINANCADFDLRWEALQVSFIRKTLLFQLLSIIVDPTQSSDDQSTNHRSIAKCIASMLPGLPNILYSKE